MEKVMNYLTGFFGGLMAIMMAILPVSILWTVLTGGTMFGLNVIQNLGDLVQAFGEGGFTGLVVLVVVMSFFIKE